MTVNFVGVDRVKIFDDFEKLQNCVNNGNGEDCKTYDGHEIVHRSSDERADTGLQLVPRYSHCL